MSSMDIEEFRAQAHALVDWIADFRAGIAARPVQAQVEPGDVLARLPLSPPDEPEPFDVILRDLDDVIAPGLSHFQHPSFFGYFPANSLPSSVLGDFMSTGLGALGLSWQSAPALAEFEERMTDWMRDLFGLSTAWQGVIQDTASTSTLLALLCARERATNFSMARGGLQDGGEKLVVYVSKYSHSSVDKAALLAGFGRDYVRPIDVDEQFALRPDALEAAIAADRAAGRKPCAIVATTGTTTSTALDPLAAIAATAQRHGLWMHVDGALAGSAMILPECRWMWDGIEGADSIVVNPHKWLGAAFDCSLFYVRDPQHLVRVMGTNPRRRDLALAQELAAEVSAAHAAGWRLVAPVPLQTVCVRHEPPGLAGEALDAHTLRWVEQVNASGSAYLTPALLGGRWMVRVSLGALDTGPADVRAVWAAMRAAAEGAGAG